MRIATCTLVLLAAVACREQKDVPAKETPAGGGAMSAGASVASTNGIVIARHDDRIFAGGIAPPAEKFVNGAEHDDKAADEGSKLFTSMNCDGCHGGGVTFLGGGCASSENVRTGTSMSVTSFLSRTTRSKICTTFRFAGTTSPGMSRLTYSTS